MAPRKAIEGKRPQIRTKIRGHDVDVTDENEEHLPEARLYRGPSNGKLCGQTNRIIMPNDHSGGRVIQMIDVYLENIEWVNLWQFKNDTDQSVGRRERFFTGLRVVEGKEAVSRIDAGLALTNWAINYSLNGTEQSKMFSQRETVEDYEMDKEYFVAARSQIWVYQMIYHFRCRMWFVNATGESDDQAQHFAVHRTGDPENLASQEFRVQIHSESELATDRGPLTQDGKLDTEPKEKIRHPPNQRREANHLVPRRHGTSLGLLYPWTYSEQSRSEA